ncbi:MAG: selenocysteine-specific translation elongation factor [Clostridia bacterium]
MSTLGIIGTAGHVDHGKTRLIRALTGIDTDRLAEEKRRGITIELGFAPLRLADGGVAGIIDVPGHEKFIAHMLSGAGGVTLALLVIAADEGIMPQTREHIEILTLLGVRAGVVAVTKCDMVDAAFLALMVEEIRGGLEGTFFVDAPLVCVSAVTGEGIEALRAELARQLARAWRQAACADTRDAPLLRAQLPSRMPIDRVFSVDGFGLVATGTLLEGAVSVGQALCCYPRGTPVRVRAIEVYGEATSRAQAGQRVAVNLAGVSKGDVARGDVLAEGDSLCVSRMLDVQLRVLVGSARSINSGSRLHFHHGARECLCKVTLLGRDALAPGESGLAQLRFDEDVCAKAFDRFVVRFYSPLETIGGGVVLDPAPPRRKKNDAEALQEVGALLRGDLAERLSALLNGAGDRPCEVAQAARRLNEPLAQVDAALGELCEKRLALAVAPNAYLGAFALNRFCARAQAALSAYHAENPLKAGLAREALRTRARPGGEIAHTDKMLDALIARGDIRESGGLLARNEFFPKRSAAQEKTHAALLAAYASGGFAPPDARQVLAQFPKAANAQAVLENLVDEGALVRVGEQRYLTAEAVAQALDAASRLGARGAFSLADFRDAIGASRKNALELLTYFDQKKYTVKQGDARTLAGSAAKET